MEGKRLDTHCECKHCGRKENVNFSSCLFNGWPTCCGETMMMNRTRANIEQVVARGIPSTNPKEGE